MHYSKALAQINVAVYHHQNARERTLAEITCEMCKRCRWRCCATHPHTHTQQPEGISEQQLPIAVHSLIFKGMFFDYILIGWQWWRLWLQFNAKWIIPDQTFDIPIRRLKIIDYEIWCHFSTKRHILELLTMRLYSWDYPDMIWYDLSARAHVHAYWHIILNLEQKCRSPSQQPNERVTNLIEHLRSP